MAIRKKPEVGIAAQEKPKGAVAARSADAAQMEQLEEGIRLFREQRFREAKASFEEVLKGPQRAVAQTARNHISVCDRRLENSAPELASADDHYNAGVERLNARDFGAAKRHLEKAFTMRPDREYIVYVLAAAQSLSGDQLSAYENLRRAIDLEPRNRTSARHDPDFASVANNALFAQLLYPERGSSPG